MNKSQWAILTLLLVLVLFDAFQQHYYLTTFDLTDREVSLSNLIWAHFIRWIVWAGISITAYWIAIKLKKPLQFLGWNTRALLIVMIALCSIAIISVISILKQDLIFSTAIVVEHFQFFFFQKALVFGLAGFVFFLQVDLIGKSQNLKMAQEEIYELRQSINRENKVIQIKTGHKVQSISITEIVWIQSDDYCSKIHTKNEAYTIRKSLKSFEKDLASYRFIRVHRGALMNLDFLERINLKQSTVTLKNKAEIPASRGGIRMLKKEVA